MKVERKRSWDRKAEKRTWGVKKTVGSREGHYYRVYQCRELPERTYWWVQKWNEENLWRRNLVQRPWWRGIDILWMIF